MGTFTNTFIKAFSSVQNGANTTPTPPSGWTTYTSGLTVYRRGINDLTELYELQYSADGGGTWETLISQPIDETSIIQDVGNLYRHRIVGTAYHIDQTLTETGYAGIENTDWENIYSFTP